MPSRRTPCPRRSRSWREKAIPGQDGLAGWRRHVVQETPCLSALPCDDGDRVGDGDLGGHREGDADLVFADRGVGGIHEGDIDLGAGDIVEGLADVLRIDSLGLDRGPTPGFLKCGSGIAAGRYARGVTERDALTSSRSRSGSPSGTSVLSAGTIATSVLRAKLVRVAGSMSFCAAALSMESWSAVASTSTGAPAASCWTRASDAPKLNRTSVSGFCASKARPISLKASVRLAAADTVSSPACTMKEQAMSPTVQSHLFKKDSIASPPRPYVRPSEIYNLT